MEEPIVLKLKDKSQIAMAMLQDTVVESLLEVDPDVTIHGGTAIWRCYDGNRFSDDIDIYATEKQIKKLNNEITWPLSRRNAKMGHPIYTNRALEIYNDDAKTRFEAMLPEKGIVPVQVEYSRVNGTKMFVNTLSIEDFISEKIETYEKRRFIRDLYDIYHLASIQEPSKKSKKQISNFISSINKPIDEPKIRDLVYVGVAPSFNTMVEHIKGKSK